MTVAEADSAAPPPTWRPPADPHPHTTTAAPQPLGLCYHGNFSLSFLNDESDVGDDVVDANDIRSILELAEQCALGISVQSSAEQDMHSKEMSPPQSPCDEATAAFQPCRFKAGVKRKLDLDDWDGTGAVATSADYGEDTAGSRDDDGGSGGGGSAEYRDRQKMLEVSLCKMRRMDDPETSLRRCVLINNMTVKLRRELDRQSQQGPRTGQLPKKRHSLRRVEAGAGPAPVLVGVGAGPVPLQTSAGFRLVGGAQCGSGACADGVGGGGGNTAFPVKRRTEAPGEKAAFHYGTGLPEQQTDGDRSDRSAMRDGPGHGCHAGAVARSTDAEDGETAEDETPSIFGDIDNVFQSLLSCLGEPL